MTDIVERLRGYKPTTTDVNEAADEIERLRAHIAEIEAWQARGEALVGPAAKWGANGSVMVQASPL